MTANPSANRLNLDFRAEASRLGPPPAPITDVHTHINGAQASRLYREVCELYGVERIYSMTRFDDLPIVQEAFGDRMRFIAVPNYQSSDLRTAFTTEWHKLIERFAERGVRICKFWAAPRSRDYAAQVGEDVFSFEGKWRQKAMRIAHECGMMFMTHIADPDTWFATKYKDASKYGTKLDQYTPLERLLDQYGDIPWIAAHMGGYPENLDFLDGLLERHDNLHLDTSATKWMVRELSKHPSERLNSFLERWRGRILFGSDIVTTDEHFKSKESERGMGHLAASREQAFELYASRYWSLRTMWETSFDGESPIVDPDLHMVDPDRYDESSAPPLRGKAIAPDSLRSLYHDAATNLLDSWHESRDATSTSSRQDSA
ncbi:MAG: hypothetical protein ACF8PN_00195 [Phycisphaerales bacterium]